VIDLFVSIVCQAQCGKTSQTNGQCGAGGVHPERATRLKGCNQTGAETMGVHCIGNQTGVLSSWHKIQDQPHIFCAKTIGLKFLVGWLILLNES